MQTICKRKPIRFSYKILRFNAVSDYLLFDVYKGNNPRGKYAAPLIGMIHHFPPDVSKLPLKFYCNNLFTGFNILHNLVLMKPEQSATTRFLEAVSAKGMIFYQQLIKNMGSLL